MITVFRGTMNTQKVGFYAEASSSAARHPRPRLLAQFRGLGPVQAYSNAGPQGPLIPLSLPESRNLHLREPG